MEVLNMKKIAVLALAVLMVLVLCACGSKSKTEEEPVANMVNPVHECTKEELVQATGIALDAPDGAGDVSYSYIDIAEGHPISQVNFSLDGKKYCYRAQPTEYTSISANVAEDASSQDLFAAVNDCTNIGAALSGMHFKWECISLIDIAETRDGVVAFNTGKQGFVSWLDVVPGVLYSLSTDNGAEQDLLTDMAELCFVPLQGEVG